MENERRLKGRDRRFRPKEKGIRDKEREEERGSDHVSLQWLNEVLQESDMEGPLGPDECEEEFMINSARDHKRPKTQL